jgi:predicted metal-dependent peptidase
MGISVEIAGEDTARKLIQEAANNIDKLPKEAGSSQGLLRRYVAELSRPKVDWKSALKRFIGRAMSNSESIMPNRRFVSRGQYLTGDRNKYDALSAAVVACDTSGSMSQADITMILSETTGIINSKKIKKTEIVYFDAGIQNVDTVKFPNPTFDFDKATGGGGTTFAEPLQYMIDKFKKNQLELAIFCTDGVNSDHDAVNGLSVPNNFKKILVWLILDMPEYEPPFGAMVVHISKRDLE